MPIYVIVEGTDALGVNETFSVSLVSATSGVPAQTNTTVTDTLLNSNSLIVTSNQDDGRVGSLRQVLATAGKLGSAFAVPITFDIQAANSDTTNYPLETIALRSQLTINQEVFIVGGSPLAIVPDEKSSTHYAGNGDGLDFAEGSEGSTLQSFEVAGFQGSGVDLQVDDITIQASSIHGNMGDGVKVEGIGETIGDASRGSINTISGNSGYGIDIVTPASTPPADSAITVENNAVQSNVKGGVFVDGITSPRLLFNTLSTNSTFGIELSGTQAALVSNNTVTGSSGEGIELIGAASGSNVANNSITGVAMSGSTFDGIDAEDPGTGSTFSGNTIGGTTGVGIKLDNGTNTTISGSQITSIGDGITVGNDIDAFKITGVNITGGSVSSSLSNGIIINGGALIGAMKNKVSGVTVSGVTIGASDAGVFITGTTGTNVSQSTISGNAINGIVVFGSDGTTLDSNTLTLSPTSIGVEITSESYAPIGSINVTNNVIDGQANAMSAVPSYITGIGVYLHDLGYATSPTSAILIGNNQIHDVSDDGIFVKDSAGPVAVNLVSNAIYDALNGIHVGNSTNVDVNNNLIGLVTGTAGLGNRNDGILIDQGSYGVTVQSNVISSNTVNGVEITGCRRRLECPEDHHGHPQLHRHQFRRGPASPREP